MRDTYIFCSKCGSPMKEDARYCMKCGTLNYDHPANQSMKKYAKKNNKNTTINNKFIQAEIPKGNISNSVNDVVVGGKVIKEDSFIDSREVKSYNYISRIIYTFFFSVLCYFFFSMMCHISFNFSLLYSIFTFVFIFSGVTIANIYQKANYSFFTPFIPFYGQYVFCEMLFNKGILFLLLFIPFVNIIFSLFLLYKLGEKFGINGILSVVFSPIVLFLISYSNRYSYKGNLGNNNNIISVIGFIFALFYLISFIYSLFLIPMPL